MEKSGSPDRTFHIVRFHALEAADQLRLRAAHGYIELGMFEEAMRNWSKLIRSAANMTKTVMGL